MSISLMTLAWQTSLAPIKKMALLAMCDWANDDGASLHPSVRKVAQRLSCSERQAQRVLHSLIEEGWLDVVGNANGGAPGQSRQYQINTEKLAKTGDICDTRRVTSATETGDMSVTGDRLSRVTNKTQTGDICDTRRVTSATETGDTGVTLTTIEPSIEPSVEPSIKKTRAPVFELPEWIDRELWDAWHSCEKRRRATVLQKQLAVKKLAKWRDEGIDWRQALENAAMAGWQGLFRPEPVRQKKHMRPALMSADERAEWDRRETERAKRMLFGDAVAAKTVTVVADILELGHEAV